jgi:hypothetical protein
VELLLLLWLTVRVVLRRRAIAHEIDSERAFSSNT